VKWNSLSPEYHEQFVFLSSITDLPKQSLHITVWDKKKGAADVYMGILFNSLFLSIFMLK